MDRRDNPVDRLLDALGAAAAAAGSAAVAWLIANAASWHPLLWITPAALIGGAIGWAAMRRVPGRSSITLPTFDLPAIPPTADPAGPIALLTYAPIAQPDADELLLDQPIAAAPDAPAESRVVQLFGPQAMPTAGQLRHRIDQHLARADDPEWGLVPTPRDDASAALHAALQDIRRTLRQR